MPAEPTRVNIVLQHGDVSVWLRHESREHRERDVREPEVKGARVRLIERLAECTGRRNQIGGNARDFLLGTPGHSRHAVERHEAHTAVAEQYGYVLLLGTWLHALERLVADQDGVPGRTGRPDVVLVARPLEQLDQLRPRP